MLLPLSDDEHPGSVNVHGAADMLDAGDVQAALRHLQAARSGGVPAELVPHAAVIEGVARLLEGDQDAARRLLEDSWAGHPDVAALPAALGTAAFVAGDPTGAARAMYAAIVSDDPDGSLGVHRRRLTMLLPLLAVRRG